MHSLTVEISTANFFRLSSTHFFPFPFEAYGVEAMAAYTNDVMQQELM